MNYRVNTKIIFITLILVVGFATFFVYMLISAPVKIENTNTENKIATTTEEATDFMLTAKHQYIDGIHIVAGETELPTPCHRLVSEPFFVSDDEVEIRFSTIMVGEECESKLFNERFKVSFEASEDVKISATWNGKKARLNLIPVQDGESIDDEIYIKG